MTLWRQNVSKKSKIRGIIMIFPYNSCLCGTNFPYLYHQTYNTFFLTLNHNKQLNIWKLSNSSWTK